MNICINTCDAAHKELGASKGARDVAVVEKIRNALLDQYQNPFDLVEVPGDLVNIVTGHIAFPKVEESLSAIHKRHEKKRLILFRTDLLGPSSQ